MAYYQDSLDDRELREKEKQNEQPGQLPGMAAPGPAPSLAGSVQQPQPVQGQGAAPGASPTRFVSFDRYFNSNAQNAEKSAADMANKVGGAAESVKQKSESLFDNFTNDALKGARGPTRSYEKVSEAGYDPYYSIKSNAGSYQGPTSFTGYEGYSDLATNTTKAAGDLKATQSSEGLQSIFQRDNKYAGYTPGMSRFDAALTNRAAGDRFKNLAAKYGDLEGRLNQYETQGAQTVQGVQNAIDRWNDEDNQAASETNQMVRGNAFNEPQYAAPLPGVNEQAGNYFEEFWHKNKQNPMFWIDPVGTFTNYGFNELGQSLGAPDFLKGVGGADPEYAGGNPEENEFEGKGMTKGKVKVVKNTR